MSLSTRTQPLLLVGLASLLGACLDTNAPLGGSVGPGDPPHTAPPATSGDENTTFDHDNTAAVDPYELLDRLAQEGPPEVRARFHSCSKIRYGTIGRLLASRGVNLGDTAEFAAGNLYTTSDQALGVANYGARIPETTELTTASAAKLFDIFVAAAPEIMANMPNRPECQIGGVGAALFNADGQCMPDGITCLMGKPASIGHIDLCNSFVAAAATPDQGRVIATAAMAAAAHTCE
jgi:hypothetical protein